MNLRRISLILAATVGLVDGAAMGRAESVARLTERVVNEARTAVAELRVVRSTAQRGGSGTGFFISREGRLLTNWHVIRDAVAITVHTARGEALTGLVMTEDPEHDLAVLQIAGQDFPNLELADTEESVPGVPVTLIGGGDFPSRTGRTGSVREICGQPMLEISTPLQPGDSGSPLVDEAGRVVAMANGQYVGGTPEQDENFAVPLTALRRLLARDTATVR